MSVHYPELNHYHLANYLINRVLFNERLYHARIASFALKSSENMVFRVLYFGLAVQLDEGHTVLRLPTKSPQHTWQQALLNPSVQLIHTWLGVEMGGIFAKIDTAGADLFIIMQQFNQELVRMVDVLGVAGQQVTLLTEMVMDVARFYWWAKDKSLQQFCQELAKHPLCQQLTPHIDGDIPDRPIVIQSTELDNPTAYLWLQRTWCAEMYLARHLLRLMAGQSSLAIHELELSSSLKDEQKIAIRTALSNPFVLITGGPGTGKTHTVAHLVMALVSMGKMGALALAAPTGKAAQRMQESLQHAIGDSLQVQLPESKTIHRLLGIGVDGVPRYHADNPLAEDIIIIDEASMLGVELACQLFAAVKTGARLILLGDANQLAAVEAGAVLADLCRAKLLAPYHVALVQSRRFADDSGVGQLAKAVQAGYDVQAVLALIERFGELDFVNGQALGTAAMYGRLADGFLAYMNATLALSNAVTGRDVDVADVFEVFNAYRILCASHLGDYGDVAINGYLEQTHQALLNQSSTSQTKQQLSRASRQSTKPATKQSTKAAGQWYHGRPIMIQRNDYELGLFNGDVGICLGVDNPKVYFEHKTQGISTAMLGDEMAMTAYAITVHKSQGSEFANVTIVFDDSNERLLSQELLYTAITRAKFGLTVYSTPTALAAAIAMPTVRNTGLELQFDNALSWA
ncbi:MAG: exodeoxyribonuclease V subunit alpha [Moraxella sp.]|nr:exodeoxyribonuclease V subunit alpha [Moraxella sp.]